ncbi:MAG TPA: hypothetical protein VLA59_09320 [Patescibacteria group bacterium]|nr:hypothetical protein [Patescibacteria group bacterium]
MNVSPHQQRPTKYPWPGPASAAMVVLAIALAVLIGFMLIGDPTPDENAEPSPTGTRPTATERL